MQDTVHAELRSLGRPRPPAPAPLEKAPRGLGFLRAMRHSPIEGLTQAHFGQAIVTTKTLVGTIMVVSSPAALRHVLIENAANYRRERLQRQILASGLGIGLLAAESEQWRSQRRVMGPIFGPKAVAGFAGEMTAAAASLVQKWTLLPEGSRIDVSTEMSRPTIDIVRRTLLGDGLGDDADKIHPALMHYHNTAGRLDPLDVFEAPQWMPRIGRWRARRSIALFRRIGDAAVEARRHRLATARASAPNDLLTALLETRDPKTGQRLSTQEVKDNVATFIAVGSETSASALTWTLYLLSLDPEWRERVEAEVDRELPDGEYMDGSLDRLVATRAVIEEALRLYPPVPVTTRQAIGADRLEQQEVAPGTIIIIAPWVVHRHRLLWQAPDLFDPSRFLPGARETIDRFAYLPFGVGSRTCIGASFAMQELMILLATIVRTFRLDLAPGHKVWPLHRVTLRPQGGMPMILYRRRHLR
ncbi:MAG: cytochrome P450 [Dongiaceae bacterium]